ncbi:Trk system potassium transporter TrkA [Capnocytophaga catalasegens]|uniref:Trk system potassium uptake protein TrkA n=1 Tax=Capnocytophaga catalasegens TaxID=1004260 RepID=A0AAV5AXL0_9FLAO|nr:Trk system potassium transporter TrkA [Capnocytophaga catalasegens]GIZ15229.1 Trk system potassium transport protein TrkA [Capnocytophaga catalasegens]GJM49743.1 Trk system potassium transport protein TrkA [Capnocytophaga catalasegens]GJM52808.1 Trk system potassium transport protein TrkA [Capnocytophaga catalasegens]
MKIIIAGGGEVGFHLAKLLSYESQDITLIDTDKRSLQYADNSLDIKTIRGNATSMAVLKEADVQDADLIIGVTASETNNLVICLLAKQLGCKKSIARISNTEYIYNRKDIRFEELGIDELISPDQLAMLEIEQLVNQSAFNDMYEFGEGQLCLVGIVLPDKTPFVGKSVIEIVQLYPDLQFIPTAIQRRGQQNTLIPRGNTIFEEGDKVYFVTCKDGVGRLYDLIGKRQEKLKRVMILGGSVIGIKAAMRLSQKGFEVKLFEIDKEKAYELADQLPNVLIINGDGRDGELLDEEEIYYTDVFIAVTDDSETNVMACMMAKNRKTRKTIALSDNIDYYQLTQAIGIDTLINKKILAANSIFKYIRKGNVVAMMRLNNTNVELLEFVVQPNSEATYKQIRDIDIPRSAVIGGVVRQGKGYIPLGGFEIKVGDHVLVCCLPEAVKKIERIFF